MAEAVLAKAKPEPGISGGAAAAVADAPGGTEVVGSPYIQRPSPFAAVAGEDFELPPVQVHILCRHRVDACSAQVASPSC